VREASTVRIEGRDLRGLWIRGRRCACWPACSPRIPSTSR
jgi:hypothetical protein